ncbi:hypothetical protein [Novosphingobium sp. THN1]|uniref:hypothetical protein n=1 Tax=Novosphingobium sp. THN1 TaxID=1016987 RepID=UPI00196774AA
MAKPKLRNQEKLWSRPVQCQPTVKLPRKQNLGPAQQPGCDASQGRYVSPGCAIGAGLHGADQLVEIIKSDDSFELETGAIAVGPHEEGLDASDDREPHRNAFAPAKITAASGHEPGCRDIREVKHDIAARAMLADDRQIHGVPGRTTQVGD